MLTYSNDFGSPTAKEQRELFGCSQFSIKPNGPSSKSSRIRPPKPPKLKSPERNNFDNSPRHQLDFLKKDARIKKRASYKSIATTPNRFTFMPLASDNQLNRTPTGNTKNYFFQTNSDMLTSTQRKHGGLMTTEKFWQTPKNLPNPGRLSFNHTHSQSVDFKKLNLFGAHEEALERLTNLNSTNAKSVFNKTKSSTKFQKVIKANHFDEIKPKLGIKADIQQIAHMDDWKNNKIGAEGGNEWEKLKKTRSFDKGMALKDIEKDIDMSKSCANRIDRTPGVNNNMLDTILRHGNKLEEDDQKTDNKKVNVEINYEKSNNYYNQQILEDLITRRVQKLIISDGQKKLKTSQVKITGSEIIAKFRVLAANSRTNFAAFYTKIEDNLETFIKNFDKPMFNITGEDGIEISPDDYIKSDEQKTNKLKEQKETREIQADFDIRLQIYEAYQRKKTKQEKINQNIGYLNIEKVKIQQVRKNMIQEMETKNRISVHQAFRVRRMIQQLNKKVSNITESCFNNKNLLDASQSIALKNDDKAQMKLEWANKIAEQENLEKNKEDNINTESDHLKTVIIQKKKQKFRLKKLYLSLQANPSLCYEKGVVLTDILVFQKIIGVAATTANLYDHFYDLEKDYLMDFSELKFQWLEQSDRTIDFITTFKTRTQLMKTSHKTSTQRASTGQCKSYKKGDMISFLDTTVKLAQEKVDQQLTCLKKQNIKITKPIKVYDYKSGIYTIKWIPEDNLYAQKLESMNQYHDEKAIYHLTEEQLGKHERHNKLIDLKLKQQKELKNDLLIKIENKIQSFSGSYDEYQSALIDRARYLFGTDDDARDYIGALQIMNQDNFKERRMASNNTTNNRMDLMTMHSLARISKKEKDSNKEKVLKAKTVRLDMESKKRGMGLNLEIM